MINPGNETLFVVRTIKNSFEVTDKVSSYIGNFIFYLIQIISSLKRALPRPSP